MEYQGELSYPIEAIQQANERSAEKDAVLHEAIHLLRTMLLAHPRQIIDTQWEKDVQALLKRYRVVRDW